MGVIFTFELLPPLARKLLSCQWNLVPTIKLISAGTKFPVTEEELPRQMRKGLYHLDFEIAIKFLCVRCGIIFLGARCG